MYLQYDFTGHEYSARKRKLVALVKQLSGSLGFNEVWLTQGVGNVNMFLNLVKQR